MRRERKEGGFELEEDVVVMKEEGGGEGMDFILGRLTRGAACLCVGSVSPFAAEQGIHPLRQKSSGMFHGVL